MENKYLKLINLNNTWVITKRHNGNIFFVRKGYVTCCKNYPNKDCIYNDETQVKEEVARLNSMRKKCKYGYENASKYFVNNWFTNNWTGAIIQNKPLSIKEVNKDTRIETPENVKNALIANTEHGIVNKMESIKRYQQELPKKIAEITAQYNKYIQDYSNERLALEVQLSELKELNLDSLLSEYETQGDKMVKVLYGSNK